jgi:hypothetical protein
MVMWLSRDQGATWQRVRDLSKGAERNHSYARKPLYAHPDFYALWADGNPLEPSKSLIYFCTRDGKVFVLPERMNAARAKPAEIHPR